MPGQIHVGNDYPEDSLFGYGRHKIDDNVVPIRRAGPDTTHFAQKAAFPKSGTQRRRVYDAIHNAQYGLTIDELCTQLQMLVQSVCPAVNTLSKNGWIADSGHRRNTRTGHQAIVWSTKGQP